jgi:GNAT superfamily N-acetyltransferase
MKRSAKKSISFEIRRATPRHIPTLLRLIRGLAKYEKLAHEVNATAERLRRHGFGRQRYFDAIICWHGREAVGYALYFFTYSTFKAAPILYLEDLFVVPERRGQGAGKALLSAVARIARGRGCARMEWLVLRNNAPAIRFYKWIGASLRREWILTRLKGNSLGILARRAPLARS